VSQKNILVSQKKVAYNDALRIVLKMSRWISVSEMYVPTFNTVLRIFYV